MSITKRLYSACTRIAVRMCWIARGRRSNTSVCLRHRGEELLTKLKAKSIIASLQLPGATSVVDFHHSTNHEIKFDP